MSRSTILAFKQMLLQVRADAMLFVACLAPILAGVFIRFIPWLEKMLCGVLGKGEFLTPYYIVFDLALFLVTPVMFAFVGALVVLGEIDDKIAGYMSVTPIGKKGYLLSRLGYPMIISFIITVILGSLFHLTQMSWLTIIGNSLFQVLNGLCISLMIVSLSSNKVEGMAMGKLSGIITLGMFVPFIIKGNIQYVSAVLPSFWLGKYMENGNLLLLAVGFAILGIWIALLQRRYLRKI